MKLFKIIAAAGLAVATIAGASAADAQNYRHHRGDGYQRYDHRGDYGRYHRWDRGYHAGWNRHHRRCHVEWRHHHRVTICRGW
jgi:opacity protein-like surface antigen